MIITIKGADFSAANIGTLSTYIISKSIGSGATFDIPNFVEKNSSATWTITLNEGYTFGTYSVTMGGVEVTPTVVDNVMTISIAEVTGNVRIVVATVNENTGEEETPVVPPVEPDEPEEPETPATEFVSLTGWDYVNANNGGTINKARYITYDTIPVNAVVNFKNTSGWETYKYAISNEDKGISSKWIGDGYQSGGYTVTSEGKYTIMVAKQDNTEFTAYDCTYIQNNMGYKL